MTTCAITPTRHVPGKASSSTHPARLPDTLVKSPTPPGSLQGNTPKPQVLRISNEREFKKSWPLRDRANVGASRKQEPDEYARIVLRNARLLPMQSPGFRV